MPGPLPQASRRRRNAPTIPTTNLPAGGRGGQAPKPPVELGVAGRAWWAWAWKTPQAAAWSPGDLYALGRRAMLEDDLATLELTDDFDLRELLEFDDEDIARRLESVIRKLKALAGGKMGVLRETRELDDRFGLTPKALAALRWTVVAEPAAEPAKPESTTRRLHAVDPVAATGV